MRKLTKDDVSFSLHVEQDLMPVRGNALASGDDKADKECEDEIFARLNRGDIWAWAWVEVTATYTMPDGQEFHGCASIGGCNYRDEKDFMQPGGYYDDLKAEALDNLQLNIEATIAKGLALARHFE